MSCSGSHLEITINIKNTKFVKDLPMIDAQFRFNQCNSFREEYISEPGERYRLLRASGLGVSFLWCIKFVHKIIIQLLWTFKAHIAFGKVS
jgi:hypothetical protein